MRRLSIALTISMLLAPATSLAAYMSPSELFTALQANDASQNFSLEAHAHTNGAYISVWLSGNTKGGDVLTMDMSAKATVDVVLGGLKIRTKADVIIVGDTLYVRLSSFDGTYENAFASFSTLIKQKLWIRMPVEEAMLSEMTGGTPLSVGYSYDPTETNTMFHMQTSAGKNGTTVYSLSLAPEYAPTLAMMIRELLNDQSPASDDFFPWRQLAEGLRYDGTVVLNANGGLVSSNFSLNTTSESSSLSVSGKMTPASSFTVSAPANSVTTDELMLMFNDINTAGEDDVMYEDTMDYMEEDSMSPAVDLDLNDSTFDEIDESNNRNSTDCTDPELSPLKLLDLQRSGVCPVEKTTTRHGGW